MNFKSQPEKIIVMDAFDARKELEFDFDFTDTEMNEYGLLVYFVSEEIVLYPWHRVLEITCGKR